MSLGLQCAFPRKRTVVLPVRCRSSLGYSLLVGSTARPRQQRCLSRKNVLEVKTPSPAPTSTK